MNFIPGYSHLVCDTCKERAIEAYKFRQICIVSNDQIRADFNVEAEEYEEEIYEEPEIANETEKTGQQFVTNEASVNYEIIEDCSQESFEYPSESEAFTRVDEHENVEHQNRDRNISSHSKSARKYACQLCSKRFETPSKVQRHMIVHRDVLDPSDVPQRPPKEYKYMCLVCEKLVETPSKLERHMRVHEKSGKLFDGINQHRPFACTHCEMRFWDKVKLERHLIIHSEAFENSKIQHPDGHLFTCVICLLKIPSYEECMQHMRNHREDYGESVEIGCKLCPKVYPKLVNLIRHSKVHAENATHQCIHCGKKMGVGDDFIDHMLRHEGFKPYTCDMPACGKKFVKIHKLRQHMETHLGSKSFACGQCDKKFSEQEYLRKHLLRHDGRKDHLCHICQARFTFKSALNSHITTHMMKKSFSCNLCPSKFTKLSSLRTHLKIHSGDVSAINYL